MKDKNTERAVDGRDPQSGRFLAGNNGGGRQIGARNKLSEGVLHGLARKWAAAGDDVLDRVAKDDPSTFLRVVASLIPKSIEMSLEQRTPGNLDAESWSTMTAIISAVRQAIPDAGAKDPNVVLTYVLDAINAAAATPVLQLEATTIEHGETIDEK